MTPIANKILISLFYYQLLQRIILIRYIYEFNHAFNQYSVLDGMIDNNGSGISYTYDTGLRMTQKDIYPGTGVQGTTQEMFTYDGADRMTQATNYDGATQISQIAMSYDSIGNILSETQNGKTVTSAYDELSFRTSLAYPSGTKTVTFEPDDLNRIERITQNAQLIAQYTYAGLGRVTGRSYYNGTSLSVTYDGGRRAITYTHGTTIGGFEYAFDKEDNKKYEKRSFGTKGDAFRYDAIYRLTGVKYGISNTYLNPSTPYENYSTYDSKEEFSLDGVGNRLNVYNGITTTYTTNNLNQYTQISSTNFTYDLNGNLKDDGINTYVYDYANRLLRATRKSDSTVLGEYKYDATGRRIQKTDNLSSTTYNYYYDGVRCIEERNSLDVVLKTYVFGSRIDEVLTVEQNSNTYYYHENSVGSIYAVTDNSGVVVERYNYTAYGAVTFLDGSGNPITQSVISNRILYTGREYDSETGLYYYRARYYSADLGRFLARDPIEDDILLNLYTYVSSNPINFNDPFGTDKNRGQTNAGTLQREKLVEIVGLPTNSIPQLYMIVPPIPQPPVIKCDKWGEYNKIVDAFADISSKLKKDPHTNECNLWQREVWRALQDLANKLREQRNESRDGKFEHWNYDAVNMIGGLVFTTKLFIHTVAVWQKGTDWKQGKLFDQGGWIKNIPPITPKWRRNKDKTRDFDYEPPVERVAPQPYKWGEKYR